MIAPVTGVPARPFAEETDSKLNISVVFTSVNATLAALREAGNLASNLGGRITLIVPQIVPYPLPLTSPPVSVDFNERRLRVIASNCRVETRVSIYLCRDPVRDSTVRFEAAFSGGGRKPQELVADCGKTIGRQIAARWSRSGRHRKGISRMLDLFYVAIGCLFLLVCWAFTKACDKL